jgi:uncharacterized protein (TIGR02145 family)
MRSPIYSPFIVILLAVIILYGCKDEPEPTPFVCGPGSVVMDGDGYLYNVVQIGNQCWMAENLRAARFSTKEIISFSVNAWWPNLQFYPAAASYNGDSTFIANYGRLYNFYSTNDWRGICPKGWHVPSDAEFQELIDYLGGPAVAGGKLKDTITWNAPNTGATNSTGFGGRAGGYRTYGTSSFYRMGTEGYYWTSTRSDANGAYYYTLSKDNDSIVRKGTLEHQGIGRSCRCVKDAE